MMEKQREISGAELTVMQILWKSDKAMKVQEVYDDPHQNLHIDLKKGTQLLDGEKACHLLQYRRGYTDGDITRIQMQQQFLKS